MSPIPVPSPAAEPRRPFVQRLAGLRRQMSWKQAFTALKYPNYRLWFWGQMSSLFGTWMQSTALAFFVFQLTKSSAYLGYVGFATGLPTWVFMLFAGVIADRIPKRTLIIITQTFMMTLAFILAAITFLRVVRPWHILLIASLLGVANAFEAPARQAFVLDLVELQDMTNAIALNAAMFNTATAIGPAVAGVVYAIFGPAWCFTINGLSFIAVIIPLSLMKLKAFVPRPTRNSALADLKEGLKYVAKHPLVRTIIGQIAVVSLFGIAYVTLLPAWAVKMLGGDAETNGFLYSARGLGALTGALLIASLGRFRFRGKLLTAGTVVMPVVLLIFSFVRWTPLSVFLLFCAGLSTILIFNLSNALVQTFAPNELRGRVMSVYSLVFFGSMPLAALGIGSTAHVFGERTAVIMGASITALAVVLIYVFFPRLRRQS